jgi:hypothetical protein
LELVEISLVVILFGYISGDQFPPGEVGFTEMFLMISLESDGTHDDVGSLLFLQPEVLMLNPNDPEVPVHIIFPHLLAVSTNGAIDEDLLLAVVTKGLSNFVASALRISYIMLSVSLSK